MFSLSDKIKYYKSRFGLSDSNKREYARGFVNGASRYHTKWHYSETKKELSELYRELKTTKNVNYRQILIESISYCKGCLSGYEQKNKR